MMGREGGIDAQNEDSASRFERRSCRSTEQIQEGENMECDPYGKGEEDDNHEREEEEEKDDANVDGEGEEEYEYNDDDEADDYDDEYDVDNDDHADRSSNDEEEEEDADHDKEEEDEDDEEEEEEENEDDEEEEHEEHEEHEEEEDERHIEDDDEHEVAEDDVAFADDELGSSSYRGRDSSYHSNYPDTRRSVHQYEYYDDLTDDGRYDPYSRRIFSTRAVNYDEGVDTPPKTLIRTMIDTAFLAALVCLAVLYRGSIASFFFGSTKKGQKRSKKRRNTSQDRPRDQQQWHSVVGVNDALLYDTSDDDDHANDGGKYDNEDDYEDDDDDFYYYPLPHRSQEEEEGMYDGIIDDDFFSDGNQSSRTAFTSIILSPLRWLTTFALPKVIQWVGLAITHAVSYVLGGDSVGGFWWVYQHLIGGLERLMVDGSWTSLFASPVDGDNLFYHENDDGHTSSGRRARGDTIGNQGSSARGIGGFRQRRGSYGDLSTLTSASSFLYSSSSGLPELETATFDGSEINSPDKFVAVGGRSQGNNRGRRKDSATESEEGKAKGDDSSRGDDALNHIYYDHEELEPAFLRDEDYPVGWLTYHPVYGVIRKDVADALKKGD